MIDKALLNLRPGAIWSMSGDDYSGLEWLDTVQTKPTVEEVEQEVKRLQQAWAAFEYQQLRASEYPPLQDLADALYWQAQGNSQPMTDYLTACQAVKARYPKGSTNA